MAHSWPQQLHNIHKGKPPFIFIDPTGDSRSMDPLLFYKGMFDMGIYEHFFKKCFLSHYPIVKYFRMYGDEGNLKINLENGHIEK